MQKAAQESDKKQSGFWSKLLKWDFETSKWICGKFSTLLDAQKESISPEDNKAITGKKILTHFWKYLSFSNEGWLWLLLMPYLYYSSVKSFKNSQQDRQTQFLAFSAACIPFDLMCIGLIKIITRRKRPSFYQSSVQKGKKGYFETHYGPDEFSFPSGHCSRAMIICYLAYFFQSQGLGLSTASSANAMLAGITAWSALMGLSRVSLARHYLSDVLIGYAAGLLEVNAVYYLLKTPLAYKLTGMTFDSL